MQLIARLLSFVRLTQTGGQPARPEGSIAPEYRTADGTYYQTADRRYYSTGT